MASFQISDPTSVVALTDGLEGGRMIAKGSVVFVVENTTPLQREAIARILVENDAELGQYSLAGGSVANPGIASVAFTARQSQNVVVNIAAAKTDKARPSSFRLRMALESDPENDAADSRPVAFTVAAMPATPAVTPGFPWWAVAAAAVLVLLVGGFGAWLLNSPAKPDEKAVDLKALKSIDQMISYLDGNKADIRSVNVLIDRDLCVNNGDHLTSTKTADGLKSDVSVNLGASITAQCPSVTPQVNLTPKLSKFKDWGRRNTDIPLVVPPLTKAEFLEYLEQQRDKIGALRMIYDNYMCVGMDQISQEVAVGSAGKPTYRIALGANTDSPCQLDEDTSRQSRQKISDFSRWASDHNITVFRP